MQADQQSALKDELAAARAEYKNVAKPKEAKAAPAEGEDAVSKRCAVGLRLRKCSCC